MTIEIVSAFPTPIPPGRYRATAATIVSLFKEDGESRKELESRIYQSGETIDVPAVADGFWYGAEVQATFGEVVVGRLVQASEAN